MNKRKNKANIIYVGGSFDDYGGRFSKIAHAVFKGIDLPGSHYINGGCFKDLEEIVREVKGYDLIYWFADIPNDKPKLVGKIKQLNKKCVLITSKRNIDDKYSLQDILYKALGVKSNLLVEFTQDHGRYHGRVIDPLGNVFLNFNDDFKLIGRILGKRAKELSTYTRVSSRSVGKNLEVPDEKGFFEAIKHYAGVFHDLIHSHPKATNRFFGNASFMEANVVFVSRRNIDKRFIGKEGFVAVKPELPVQFYGSTKPSVDTPIQVRLYQHYPKIKYLLHSHAYVKNAPFTKNLVPCGALEEADEILGLFPDKDTINFAVNLRGHGSLLLVSGVNNLENINYYARTMPEIHELK